MNKWTAIIVGIALVLGVCVKVFLVPETQVEEKSITLPGYLPAEGQAEWQKRQDNMILFIDESEEEKKKKFKPPLYDEITLWRKGAEVTFKKDEKDKPWRMVAPVESKIEERRIAQMIEAFATDTHLSPVRSLTDAMRADFGLDDARVIKVKVREEGTTVFNLEIGDQVQVTGSEASGRPVYDTFVVDAANPDMLYRAQEKELRKPFDQPLSTLREKNVFDFDKSQITRVVIEDPSDTAVPRIVLAAKWTDKPGAASSDPTKPKPAQGAFELVEPKVEDFDLADLDRLFSRVAGLRALEFMMGEKPTEETGLLNAATAPRITLEMKEGGPITVLFGNTKEVNRSVYAQVSGRNEYMAVAKNTKEVLIPKLSALRSKKVFGEIADSDISRMELKNAHSKDGAMVFERGRTGWQMTSPIQQRAYDKEADSLLSGLKSLTAQSFLDAAPEPSVSGLDAPAIVLKATVKGVEQTVNIGKQVDGEYYAHRVGTAVYFRISKYTVENKFEKKTPADFRDKKVLNLGEASAIASLKLVHNDETVELHRVPGQDKLWEMTAPTPMIGVTGLDDVKVEAIAKTMAALEIKSFLSKPPKEVGLITPAFKAIAILADGTAREVWVSDTLETDKSHPVQVKAPGANDAAVYTLTGPRVLNLRKRMADLKKTEH